jgi:hypothetical protein
VPITGLKAVKSGGNPTLANQRRQSQIERKEGTLMIMQLDHIEMDSMSSQTLSRLTASMSFVFKPFLTAHIC